MKVILNIFVESKDLTKVTKKLTEIDCIEDVYEVTGESDIVVVLDVPDVLGFREVLKDQILGIDGIRSTVSSVITYIHKKDGSIPED
ncbi:MAG: Lrp/AsnC ligand binding domain-containing protein [Candidatus Thorarchaeota archaeon]|nr:Lrp/AsnC ligand binding domain-containing protein [Candidatus Thorarchaeota archaeon]